MMLLSREKRKSVELLLNIPLNVLNETRNNFNGFTKIPGNSEIKQIKI